MSDVACAVIKRRGAPTQVAKLRRQLDEEPASVVVLGRLARCGDVETVMARFDQLDIGARQSLADQLVRTRSGQAFLIERLKNESVELELRLSILSLFSELEMSGIVRRFEFLYRRAEEQRERAQSELKR